MEEKKEEKLTEKKPCLQVCIYRKYGDFELRSEFQTNAKKIGIYGPSGAGKSLTLKSIAGIEQPDDGQILWNGISLFDKKYRINIKCQDRRIGYLFQNYALFPTMSVRQNIMAVAKGKRKEKQELTDKLLKLFRLKGHEDQLPGQLSGGQKQRTALARILASKPGMILLDEPFSSLDRELKHTLRKEFFAILEEYTGQIIMVSHDREELNEFCDEIMEMQNGRIVSQKMVRTPGRDEDNPLVEGISFTRVYADGYAEEGSRMVAHEKELLLRINGQTFDMVHCTDDHLEEMVIGRLYAEGYIETKDDLLEIQRKESTWDLRIKTQDIRPMLRVPVEEIHPQKVFDLVRAFAGKGKLHAKTEGTHSCVLAVDGQMIAIYEDISRHCALDKAIGHMVINGLSPKTCMLYTTGRIQEDVAGKVIRAGIPVLISKALPTAEAVGLAKAYGLRLYCRAWQDSYERY